MMTPDEESCSLMVIEFCRDHFRKLGAVEFTKLGARAEDIAIASIYASLDLAQHHTGDPASALAWVRQALDLMEHAPLTAQTVQ